MAWEYKREESEFKLIPEGKHRIRIKAVDKAVSKAGNDMLSLQFDVSGENSTLYHSITFLADRPEITNRMLTSFFDSFKDIPDGDFNMQNWIGKVGACVVKHEEWNGKEQARISYFIKADKQDDLPPWQNPTSSASNKASNNDFVQVDTSNLPFI